MKTASINLNNVDVIFPIYNASNLSLSIPAINKIIGKKINYNNDGISL